MAKDQLMNLADAIVEDVLAMSDEEVLAETSEEELAEAYKARERALEAAHNGGLSPLGVAILAADRPFFECPGCGADLAIEKCKPGCPGRPNSSLTPGKSDA